MSESFAQLSFVMQLVWAYGWGLATCLTPCVFPLIPITLAVFGASTESSRKRAFLLALTYVVGMACTYTALGVIAAKTKIVFGSSLGNPYIVFPIVVLLLLLSLFSLEVLKFDLAYRLQTSTSKVGGKGFGGAFLMGTVSGLVAAPCVGPALVAILAVAASSGNAFRGGALLFIYAMGMGTLFIALGTFPTLLKRLPRSGNWLHGVKYLIAVALAMVAIFLAQPFIVPALEQVHQIPKVFLILITCALIILCVPAYRLDSKVLKAFSALGCAFFLYVVTVFVPVDHKSIAWMTSIDQSIQKATQENKKMMLDFSASWCAACKEFELRTFPTPAVVERLAKLVTVRVDFTDSSTDENQKLSAQYGIVGLPAILFLDSKGVEIPNTRVTGFLESEPFAKVLDEVLSGSLH